MKNREDLETITTGLVGEPVTIQSANWRDLNQLRELEKVCFPRDAWPLWDLISVLALPNVVRLKAMAGEQMVGFLAADQRPSERLAWIATIGVLPEYRRQGIATALINRAEHLLQVPRIRLCVRLSNQGAIDLYRREGYQRISIWPSYYQDGEDAIVMEKSF